MRVTRRKGLPEDADCKQYRNACRIVQNYEYQLAAARFLLRSSHEESSTQLRQEAYPESRAIQHSLCEHDEMICARDIDVEEEADEVSVIVVTDAVVHPRAVVVWNLA